VNRALLVAPRASSSFADEARTAAFRANLHDIVVEMAPPLNPGVGISRLARMFDAVEKSDAVVVAGGPLLHVGSDGEGRYSEIRTAAATCGYARARGKRVALVGVGVGVLPRAGDRALARALVRCSNLLVLRDEESSRALAAVGAPTPFWIGSDPCWMLSNEPPAEPSWGNQVVVAIDDYPIDVRGIALVLDLCRDQGFEVNLIPCLGGNHWRPWTAERIAAATRRDIQIADPVPDLLTLTAACRGARAVVTSSVAGIVAATNAGASFIALEGEPGSAALARRLGATVAPSHPEALASAIGAAPQGRLVNPSLVRKQIESAEEGFRLLRVLLHRGRTVEASELHGLPLGPVRW
jgi:polysaccharide pyruvyl transferase WcaK-like protein